MLVCICVEFAEICCCVTVSGCVYVGGVVVCFGGLCLLRRMEVCVMGICGESRDVYVVFGLECRE